MKNFYMVLSLVLSASLWYTSSNWAEAERNLESSELMNATLMLLLELSDENECAQEGTRL